MKTKTPRFLNVGLQGDFAEMRFLVDATAHGLFLSRPFGNSMPYDFVADNLRRFLRIQVKSVSTRRLRTYYLKINSKRRLKLRAAQDPAAGCWIKQYMIGLGHGHRVRAYRPSEIDFVAALVIPENTWYIIPVRAIGRRTAIGVFPQIPNSRGMFERYKEAWHLLQ